jgi:hypothetical protein
MPDLGASCTGVDMMALFSWTANFLNDILGFFFYTIIIERVSYLERAL